MSVQKQPNGTWYYRFIIGKRSFRKQGFTSRTAAEKEESVIRDRLRYLKSIGQELNNNLRLSEAADMFFEEFSLPTKKTWKTDRAHIRAMKTFFRNRRIREISHRDVEAFRHYVHRTMKNRQGNPISLHTVNHYHASLKAIINWVRKRRLYNGQNPAWGVDMARVPKARVRFLKPDEERRLTPVVAKYKRLWPYYLLGLQTGMRISEICAIRVKDVIRFPKPMIFIPNSKTSRSRYVPASDRIAVLLAGRIRGKPDEMTILEAVDPRTASKWFNEACLEAQVKDFTFHCLRHTFASHMLTKGVPIYKVSKILGHSTIRTTEEHYGHLDHHTFAEDIQQIESVITVPELPKMPNGDGKSLEPVKKLSTWEK